MAAILERMYTLTPEIDGGDYIGDLSHVQTLVLLLLLHDLYRANFYP